MVQFDLERMIVIKHIQINVITICNMPDTFIPNSVPPFLFDTDAFQSVTSKTLSFNFCFHLFLLQPLLLLLPLLDETFNLVLVHFGFTFFL